MKRARSSSTLTTTEAPPWLHETVYAPRYRRTVELVQQSVDALREKRCRISLAAIVSQSRLSDTEGRGISESAILGNAEARAYYERYRTWKKQRFSSRQAQAQSFAEHPPRESVPQIKATRDEARVRQRYLRLSKQELVERLLRVEYAYAEQEERWLQINADLLTWRLRAEAAEVRAAQPPSSDLPS